MRGWWDDDEPESDKTTTKWEGMALQREKTDSLEVYQAAQGGTTKFYSKSDPKV